MDNSKAVNLDDMPVEDLQKFIDTQSALIAYAVHKRNAHKLRLEGKIQKAMYEEAEAEEIYDRLPADVRW